MRTLESVVGEMQMLFDSVNSNSTKLKVARAKKRLEFLRLIKNYLKENPTEDFVNKEISRIENRINLLHDGFDDSQYKDLREKRREYEKQMGIPQLRIQLSALIFIKN